MDKGQFEAGNSLGLGDGTVMQLIILPQAVRNILPALGNEFITLVKETSIAGTMAVNDLTKAAEPGRRCHIRFIYAAFVHRGDLFCIGIRHDPDPEPV